MWYIGIHDSLEKFFVRIHINDSTNKALVELHNLVYYLKKCKIKCKFFKLRGILESMNPMKELFVRNIKSFTNYVHKELHNIIYY